MRLLFICLRKFVVLSSQRDLAGGVAKLVVFRVCAAKSTSVNYQLKTDNRAGWVENVEEIFQASATVV